MIDGRPIRLVQVTHGMGIGGMERVTADLVRNLQGNGYQISIFCTHERGELAKEVEALGCDVHFEEPRGRMGHWSLPFRIWQYLRRVRPDVVHTQHFSALMDATLAARLAGVPALVHTDHSKLYPVPRRYIVIERLMAAWVDAYCAVSEHTKNDLVRHVGMPAGQVRVMMNGFDFDRLPDEKDGLRVRQSLGIPAGARVLGTIARLEPQKSQDVMIDAMPAILQEFPDTHLVIVGGGSLESALRERVHAAGLQKNVHLTGWQTVPDPYLAAMDVFVLSSLFEGLPIAILQAMAAGRPVVSTDAGGVKEVIHHERHGIIVPERNAESFSKSTIDLLRRPEAMRAFGEAAQAYYRDHLRVACMVREYDRVYRDCLSRQGIRG